MLNDLKTIAQNYADYALNFLGAIADKEHRLYFLYLLSSLIFAFFVFKRSKRGKSFFAFLFPKSVWSHPTAKLDVKYFFFHGLTGHFLMSGITLTAYLSALDITVGLDSIEILESAPKPTGSVGFLVAIFYLGILLLVSDFMSYCLHYLQHKLPILWQFHKVHHSGEVMHPLSNFREHPVDNFTYKLITSFCSGLMAGLILNYIGYKPTKIEIFGIAAVGFAFNMTAYQLRHSHIWLRWPGNWSKVFASPAHHQVHHSRHPDHLDKNFAFILPLWDVLFKTYEMPETNKDVEFGIVEDASELNSCVNLYVIPFRDAYRVIKGTYKKSPEHLITPQNDPLPDLTP